MDPNAASPDQLRDIQGFQPVEIPLWLWIFLALLLLSLLVWLLLKYVFKPKPELPLSLFEKTVLQLQELDLNQESKNFYLDYSELVRVYLEERLQISLLDKTAEEIKPMLMAETRMNTTSAMALSQIFARADLAKFARQEIPKATKEADITQTIQTLQSIEDFVRFEEAKIQEQETMNQGGMIA